MCQKCQSGGFIGIRLKKRLGFKQLLIQPS